jgi:F0F1-type ATP synthase beta subunit
LSTSRTPSKVSQVHLSNNIALLEGKGDDYPEAAFYMQGTLDEAFEEGKRLAMSAAKK